VGNSRPASGSEHHLSHYFEIVGLVRGEEYFPHGIDVCFSAIETAKLREKLLALDGVDAYVTHHDAAAYESEIRRIYGPLAAEVLALQAKLGWYEIDRVAIYRERWEEIRAVLADAPSAAEMLALVEKIGLSYEKFVEFYGEKKIADATWYAKDLKDRYTVLWMYYDLLHE
jgi:glycerol-1-phosphate dehydrogenase [NAD(P)+]